MSMTDPVADMLTRIRNANTVYKSPVKMPSSKLKVSLAALLHDEGYIESYEVELASPGAELVIHLKIDETRTRSISGVSRVSKPGRRVYARADKIPKVLGGLGVAVVSTSRGLMSDSKARANHVGGEILCYVW